MEKLIYEHLDEVTALVLFGVGFTLLLVDKNLIKKIIGFSMMDSGIYLFLASYGYIANRLAPIYADGNLDPDAYVNPLPAGLVLTGIVV
ncbi:MAG: NADH-quinone oxidoreductase subunit K, partial [Clostridia bacterium]|nr:NADH-quinone oxidoreductase subunit K [Clostridia bacterium]